ncbi:MAG: hypothetical protein D3903_05160 [Candidatus Electrothrix sp. GM3_4]|nr:hypothetical protein [Candidatus Electrothrix sp. GM3_4]
MERVSHIPCSPFDILPVFWLTGGLTVLFAFATGVVFTPWYISAAIFAAALLSTLIILNPVRGAHLLILLVPVTVFSVGFIIRAPWNYEIAGRYADKFPVFTPVVFLTVTGLLLTKFAKIKQIDFSDPLVLSTLLMLVYATLSLAWSANPGHSLFQLFCFLLNFFVYLVIVSLVRNEDEYHSFMWTWIISMAIQGIIAVGLFSYESVDFIYQILPNFLFQFKVYGGLLLATGAPNPAAALQDFHETSLLTNMAAALAFGMAMNLNKRGKKFLLLIILFLFFLFITLRTESRAGIGSMLVMLMMLALLIPQFKLHRLKIAVVFLLCAGSIYSMTHIYLHTMTEVEKMPRMVFIINKIIGGDRLIDTAHKDKKQGRMYMYKRSFRTLFSDNPLRGLGVGNLTYLVQLPHAHSLYFSLILDFGLAGCIFLAVLAKTLLHRCYLIMKLPDSRARTMALAATAGLVGAAVHCLVDFSYNYTSIWLFLGFVMSSYKVALSVGGKNSENEQINIRNISTSISS